MPAAFCTLSVVPLLFAVKSFFAAKDNAAPCAPPPEEALSCLADHTQLLFCLQASPFTLHASRFTFLSFP